MLTVLAAGAIVLGASAVFGAKRDETDLDDLLRLGIITCGLIVVHHLVVERRLVALGLGALTAIYSVVGGALLVDNDAVVLLGLGLVVAGAFAAAAWLSDAVPPGVLAFVPLLVLAFGGLPSILVGALLGLAAVVLIVTPADPAPAPHTAGGLALEAAMPAVSPAKIDFADGRSELSEVAEAPRADPTTVAPTKSRWAPEAFERAEVEQPPVPRISASVPADPPTPSSEAENDFHLVLGQPSRADGLPGELAVMPVPFTAGVEADSFTAGSWHLQARSSRGSSHVHGGEPRQDTYAMSKSADGGYLIVAVADGLGSADRSNFGSYWATRLAVATLARELSEGVDVVALLRELPVTVASRMEGLAEQLIRASASQIAATLVVAVVAVDRPAPIWLARVGDSDALVLTGSGQWASGFGRSDDGDIETGTTNVLPIHPTSVEVRTIDGSKVRSLLLATDGVSRVIEGSPDLVGAAFAERLAEPVDSIEFQRIVDFRRRGAHDDRTVVALWHRQAGSAT